jgi:hypothetical protein
VVRDEILTYWDMCARERGSLQRGMYFRERPGISVVLMSRRPSAPYVDSLSEDGTELEYEGHDVKREGRVDPKAADQPWTLPNGSPSENARFATAAAAFKERSMTPARVRVYEKLRPGIWSDKGLFELIDHRYDEIDGRRVFRFRMRLSDEPYQQGVTRAADLPRSRIIPSWVKQVVFKRDKGKCVLCGFADELHFDHDLPYSRGGASLVPENVRLLCARHNLQKSAKIE